MNCYNNFSNQNLIVLACIIFYNCNASFSYENTLAYTAAHFLLTQKEIINAVEEEIKKNKKSTDPFIFTTYPLITLLKEMNPIGVFPQILISHYCKKKNDSASSKSLIHNTSLRGLIKHIKQYIKQKSYEESFEENLIAIIKAFYQKHNLFSTHGMSNETDLEEEIRKYLKYITLHVFNIFGEISQNNLEQPFSSNQYVIKKDKEIFITPLFEQLHTMYHNKNKIPRTVKSFMLNLMHSKFTKNYVKPFANSLIENLSVAIKSNSSISYDIYLLCKEAVTPVSLTESIFYNNKKKLIFAGVLLSTYGYQFTKKIILGKKK